jgi:hypothetical protein
MKWLLIAGCLVVPLVWGWLVNALFVRWLRRGNGSGNSHHDEPAPQAPYPDYQI